jgi:hypothetical protein
MPAPGRTLFRILSIIQHKSQITKNRIICKNENNRPNATQTFVASSKHREHKKSKIQSIYLHHSTDSPAKDLPMQTWVRRSTPLALIALYIGQTSGRDDIGPSAKWGANHLGAQTVMLANAEASGRLITADTHPTYWEDHRCSRTDCGDGGYATRWPLGFGRETDLAYVPSPMMGSHFYVAQFQAEANANVLAQHPDDRGENGLLHASIQIRGVAWNVRDLANAAGVMPDADPSKTYFLAETTNDLVGPDAVYVTQQRMRAYGAIQGFIVADHPNITAPSQQDSLSLITPQSAARGSAVSLSMSKWITDLVSGRISRGADGTSVPYAGSDPAQSDLIASDAVVDTIQNLKPGIDQP